jgi:hypothetical protein
MKIANSVLAIVVVSTFGVFLKIFIKLSSSTIFPVSCYVVNFIEFEIFSCIIINTRIDIKLHGRFLEFLFSNICANRRPIDRPFRN